MNYNNLNIFNWKKILLVDNPNEVFLISLILKGNFYTVNPPYLIGKSFKKFILVLDLDEKIINFSVNHNKDILIFDFL